MTHGRRSDATNLDVLDFDWQPWVELQGAWRGETIPALPGLYRIRRRGAGGLDYIGQTGAGSMTLRRRVSMLRGVYDAEMPYRDPHTAAPALWALRQTDDRPFEVSVCAVEGSTPWRKGLEALAIALYRQEARGSPTANFGRMPDGFRMSSANNARLRDSGRRYRGGRAAQRDESHERGGPPQGLLGSDTNGSDWCGHHWTPWIEADELPRNLEGDETGLYRIRGRGRNRLLYVGEGGIRSRLLSHLARRRNQPHHPQGQVFARPDALEFSWVVGSDWPKYRRLELETDLIGACVLAAGEAPQAQFFG